MGLIPGSYNFTINKSKRFDRTFTLPVNLAGGFAKLTMRAKPDPDSPLLFEMSSANGRLILTGSGSGAGATGSVRLKLTPAETATLDFSSAHYELEMNAAGAELDSWWTGIVTVKKDF